MLSFIALFNGHHPGTIASARATRSLARVVSQRVGITKATEAIYLSASSCFEPACFLLRVRCKGAHWGSSYAAEASAAGRISSLQAISGVWHSCATISPANARKLRLGLGARPARDPLMPALDVLHGVGNREAAKVCIQIERYLGGDIGDGVAIAGEELALGEDRVEPFQAFQRMLALRPAKFRELGYAILEKWTRMLQ